MVEIIKTDLPLTKEGYAVTASDSFIDCLTTPLKSVIGKPEYGTDLFKLKHKTISTSFLIDLKRCCKDACKHDERLTFLNAEIDMALTNKDVVFFDVYFKNYSLKASLYV